MSESDLLSFGAAMLAALAVGALAYAFLYPYFSGEREKESRLKGVIEPKGRDSLSALEQAASRRKSVADTLKDMENRQKAAEKVSLRLRLERAGLDITPRIYWLASVACGAVLRLHRDHVAAVERDADVPVASSSASSACSVSRAGS